MNELTRYIDADIPVDKGLLLAAVEGVKTYSHIIALIAAFLDDFNSGNTAQYNFQKRKSV